jgi:DNA-binding transcriptional LysR family regulator
MNRDRWLGIELRHFSALAAIASERSFRGAAERLGYVQSAISRQIAFLEQLTGARLIERAQGPRPVHLTEAGELLLKHATEILATIDAAKADLDGLEVGRVGEVRLGVAPGVATRILPRALLAFGKRSPRTRVAAVEKTSDSALFDVVREGAVDLALTHLPAESGPFDTSPLLRMPWVLVVPAGAEIATRGHPPSASELARLPLVIVQTPRTSPSVEARLRAELGSTQIVFRSSVAQTAQALAAAGVGAAVMPSLAVDERDPRTAVIELGDLLPPLAFGLVWHRNRHLSAPAAEFREVIRQVCLRLDRHTNGSRAAAPDAAAAVLMNGDAGGSG